MEMNFQQRKRLFPSDDHSPPVGRRRELQISLHVGQQHGGFGHVVLAPGRRALPLTEMG